MGSLGQGMTWCCATLPGFIPTQDNSHWVSGQWPLEGFDGNRVLEVLALIKVVALCVLQVPVESELVPLDLSDVFSFTNVDLLQACPTMCQKGTRDTLGRAWGEGHSAQGAGGVTPTHAPSHG